VKTLTQPAAVSASVWACGWPQAATEPPARSRSTCGSTTSSGCAASSCTPSSPTPPADQVETESPFLAQLQHATHPGTVSAPAGVCAHHVDVCADPRTAG